MTPLDPLAVAGAAAAVLGIGVPVGVALARRAVVPLRLCCIAGPLAGQEWTLTHPLRVGRSIDSDLRVAESGASRRHAVVEPHRDSVRLRDLGSVDGVWSDGRRIFDAELRAGEQFQIGANVFALTRDGATTSHAHTHRSHETSAVAPITFELEALVHTGHRCTVMRARRTDDGDGEPLIVKYWHDRSAAARTSLDRYIAAAPTWRASHPALVQVYGGNASAAQPYVIEEALSGASLRSRAAHGADDAEIADALTQLQDVLAGMHRHGIVHGALDAGDVFVGPNSRIRVLNAGVHRTARFDVDMRSDIDALAGMWRAFLRDENADRWSEHRRESIRVDGSESGAVATAAGFSPLRLHVRATGKTTIVTTNPFALGRALNPADRRISRWHAELHFRDNAWMVRPRTGCVVARNGVALCRESILFVGDEITLGATSVLVME